MAFVAQAVPVPTPASRDETLRWRQERERDLRAERGWLSVSGLLWLKEGETTLGSGAGNAVRLADGPNFWGTITRTGARVVLKPGDGPVREITPEDPPFQIGRTWIQLIQRNELLGLRLWDPRNARKIAFPGLRWYEVKPRYRVRGRLVPAAVPSTVRIANVIGQVNDFDSPGVVEFELGGKKQRLTPVFESPDHDELFYIFKDETSAKTTYGAGRFLYSGVPDKDGQVVLDFNRAYSPPCAFTDFATCPLPPPPNRLTVPIEAGELDPHKTH
jgi:uncharacterized protein (DUF1684 family)